MRSPRPYPDAAEPSQAQAQSETKSQARSGTKSSALGLGRNLYEEVTARIVAQLEAGRFPWVQPWTGSGAPALGLPRNGATGRRYSGINILLLWDAAVENGFATQNWLTYRQAQAAGGQVRRGEQGTIVVFADRFVPEKEKERAAREGGEPGAVAFLKRFTVFNLSQCEGLPAPDEIASPPVEREAIPVAEALIAATLADFRIGGERAFYVPSKDFIRVPPQTAFGDQINYYRTCFHELAHWTGHPTRLGRNQSGAYGSKDYGREELVAEMGSAFVCASLGIVPTVRHADYLGAWLETLREDNRAIFKAASAASKAADLLLAFGEAGARSDDAAGAR